jgi:hypothetical protein
MLNFKKILSFLLFLIIMSGSASAYFSILEYEKACNILGISIDSSESEIKKAYREKVKIVHPDRGGQHKIFCQIDEAYRFLIHSGNKSSHGFDRNSKNSNNSYRIQPSTPKPNNFKGLKYLLGPAFCYGLYRYMKPNMKPIENIEKEEATQMKPNMKPIANIEEVEATQMKPNMKPIANIEEVEATQISFFDSLKKHLEKHPYASAGVVAGTAVVAYGCYKLYEKIYFDLKNSKNFENKKQNMQ